LLGYDFKLEKNSFGLTLFCNFSGINFNCIELFGFGKKLITLAEMKFLFQCLGPEFLKSYILIMNDLVFALIFRLIQGPVGFFY